MRTTYTWLYVLTLLFAICINVSAEERMAGTAGRKIRVGALYKNDVADSYIRGIESAVDNTGMKDYVEISYFLYYYEQQGLEKLIDMITNKEVDVILGPTDSGIFARAVERRQELEAFRIPVISPLVTATAENQPEGWFFHTNVEVGRRVEAIHDYLNKCLIRSVAILYADTEFGRQAEESFRTELRENQEESYEPVPFETLQEARLGLRQILESRPEALGVFGSNPDIVGVYNHLRCMNNRGISYRPFLFTIMDARVTAHQVDDLYFVSVADCSVIGGTIDRGRVETPDEVETLTYDTCILLLSEFKRMPPGPFAPKQFRDQFAALLRGPVKVPGPKTGMAFHKYSNSVPPKVFHIRKGEVEQVNLSQVVRWPQKLSIKWELIKRRYGFWPMVNMGLLILVVVSVSIMDLKRWYGKGLIKELLRPHLHLLITVNFLLVLLLYFFLAETGRIEYDSVVMALLIAFTPSALLRTTFFETQTGRAFGLAKLYDRFLSWINDRLMMAKYRSQSCNVNVIAYHNSLVDLKSVLNQIYRSAPTEAQRTQLPQELEEALQRHAKTDLGRRRVCARRLLSRMDWNDLWAKKLVPVANEFSNRNPIDPETVIRDSVRHCTANPKRWGHVMNVLDEYMETVRKDNPRSYNEIEEKLKQALKDGQSERDTLFIRIRFLFVQFGFNVDSLIARDLLPKEYKLPESHTRFFSQRKRDSIRSWFRSRKHKEGFETSKNDDETVKDASPNVDNIM